MDSKLREVSLVTLGGGAAVELFDDALRELLRNVADPNTEPKATREIVLKVKIKPSESRDFAAVEIHCAPKLAAVSPATTHVFLGTDGRTVRAYENNPVQPDLGLSNVKPFAEGEKA